MKKIIIIVGGDPNSINSEIIYKTWNKLNKKLKKKTYIIANHNLIRDQFKKLNYSLNVVKNIKQITIPPTTGNMVLFNPKLYHQIDPVYGVKSRITIGFFFGELTKKYLCSWA